MMQFTPKLITILKSGYKLADLRADAIAGLTVAIVALPLAMALGIASGSTPEAGLITAIIAGFLISLLGGSRVQIGGPTGAFVVILYSVIAQYGHEGLLIATLMAGVMLIIAGYAKLGKVIKFIPQPVVVGFTTAIAVIIASTQVKEFFGLKLGVVPADFLSQWRTYFGALGTVSLSALAVGLEALVIIYLVRRFAPRLPAYLLALIAAAMTVTFLGLPVETIGKRFPEISPGIPAPALPDFSFALIQQLIPASLTIAFLAGIEALLSAVVADGMTGYKHRSNQELIAQGIANLGSALFGGLPATGAIARTATNITSGAKSPFAGIFHSLFLLLFVLFAADSIKYIPLPALASILFFVAWGMSEKHRFLQIVSLGGSDRVLLLLTFFLTILVDLTVAIGVGVALASLLFMVKMSQTVEMTPGGDFGGEREELYQRGELPPEVEVFWIAGPIFFGIAGEIPNILQKIGKKPKVLIIRMRLVPFLDATGAAAIGDLVKQCNNAGISLIFSALQKQPKKTLDQFQKGSRWKSVAYASSFEEAVALARTEIAASSTQ